MAVMPLTAPLICNINEDLLLHIFHFNTHLDETEFCAYEEFTADTPLVRARHTSQVCKAWRQVILGSPALWGNMIDIALVYSPSHDWIDEVMRRTGDADLSIYGHVGASPACMGFFTYLVVNHWNRVRRLDIVVSGTWKIDMGVWDILWTKPAPNLEKFIVMKASPRPQYSTKINKGPMFSDLAPSLRRFHCQMFDLDPKASWISQLSSVTLSKPLKTFQVLKLLSNTARLESLVIENTIMDIQATSGTRRPIHLPTLRLLYFSKCSVPELLVYLQSIVTMPECTLELQTKYATEHVSVELSDSLLKAVSPYIQSYFSTHRPNRLFVSVDGYSFIIQAEPFTDMIYFCHPRLTVDLRLYGHYLNPSLITAMSSHPIFKVLSSKPLETVTKFEFHNYLDSWINPDDPDFHRMLLSLSSMETLIISPSTAKILNVISLDISKMFPLLKEIQLASVSSPLYNPSEDLLGFLLRRKDAGVPVFKLELSFLETFLPRIDIYDWKFLDAVDDLVVSWTKQWDKFEYICGSGGREVLHFSGRQEGI